MKKNYSHEMIFDKNFKKMNKRSQSVKAQEK